MEISRRYDDDVAILDVAGRLDLNSSNELKASAREIVSGGNCKLIVNMAKVDFINSSGLGSLVSLLKDVRMNNGRMRLSNLAPFVKEIFEITQLDNIFDIYSDEKNARRSFAETMAGV
jgi:anti-sigma B factor antagonist